MRVLASIATAAALCAASATCVRPALADEISVAATDGYFDVVRIDPRTFAIYEPEYWQRNIAYVIKGDARALLVDSGSGTRDIHFVATKVTRKPMTAVATHVHYDHIGSHASFDQVAMLDVPENRAHVEDNYYYPTFGQSLAPFVDGFFVTEWWKPGDKIELGGRRLEVVHLPGHSSDSMALVDRASGQAFVGDFLYPDVLLACFGSADLDAYLASTRRLLADYPEIRHVYGAHVGHQMSRQSLVALEKALADILERRVAGERIWWLGWTVARYPGEGFSIFAPPR